MVVSSGTIGVHKSMTFCGLLASPSVCLSEQSCGMALQGLQSLYQQRPTPAGGAKFKESWFRYYAETDTAYILKRANETKSFLKPACWKFGTIDLAISKRTSADFTVMCVWSVSPESDLLLLHVFRDRVSDAESLAQVAVLHGLWRPDFWKFEVAFQEAIFNQAVRKGIPCRPFRPDGDKERRAVTAAVWLENEKAFYPEHAKWLEKWKSELIHVSERGA